MRINRAIHPKDNYMVVDQYFNEFRAYFYPTKDVIVKFENTVGIWKIKRK